MKELKCLFAACKPNPLSIIIFHDVYSKKYLYRKQIAQYDGGCQKSWYRIKKQNRKEYWK